MAQRSALASGDRTGISLTSPGAFPIVAPRRLLLMVKDPKRAGMLSIIAALLTPS